MISALRLPVLISVLLAMLVLVVLVSLGADTRQLRIAVEGGHFHAAPAVIRLRIRIEPDEANRGLDVRLDSGVFFRSSWEDLQGVQAPITRWIDYRDVPAGDYLVYATVVRPSAHNWHGQTTVTVLGRE